jgi:hypothetical protein
MKWLLVAGAAALSFTGYVACRSIKGQRVNPVIQKNLVKWESTGDSASSASLVKDTAGNIISVETNLEINRFGFCEDSLTLTEFSKTENRIVYEFKGKRDSTGKLMSGVATASYSVNSPDTVIHHFEYNAEGYLIKEFRDYGNHSVYTIVYEYEQGDAVKIYTYYNDELYNTKSFEYFTDRKNVTGLEDFKFRKNINGLAGKTSNHLVKKISSVARTGKLNYSFNYEYETDEEGLPVKAITMKGKKVNSVTTYFYTAKA